jgi:septal ring factor EnvC (AmiA/AmiB activator)
VAGESNTIRIGNPDISRTYISGISGHTAAGGTAVFVESDGTLGTITSSKRFKDEIKPMSTASEAILALKPVTFRYKENIDPARTSQFGLVAEDVEKVNPDLVVRDKEGKPYSVRYDQVNAMLLNEFLKEHKAFVEEQRKVEKLEATVAQERKDFEAAVAQLKTQVQKVSAQLEVSKPAPQTVLNNQ